MPPSRNWRYIPDPFSVRRVPVRARRGEDDEPHATRQSAEPAGTPATDETRSLAERADQVAQMQEQNRELLAEVERWRALAEEREAHARTSAVEARQSAEELERAKARILREARKDVEQNKRGVLGAMIEILDDLARAIAAAEDSPYDPALLRGVDLIRKNFLVKLASFDVVHEPCLGEGFDPERHEAVSVVPVDKPERDGIILGVVREAYAIGRDILRPAAVAVGRFVE